MSAFGFVALGLSASAFLFLLVGVRAAFRSRRALIAARPSALEAPLTVIVPARNEAARIEATLDALLKDPAESLRVFVVDDASTDDTARRVAAWAEKDARLTLLSVTEKPAGLFGKPAALAFAVEAIAPEADDLLLFLDADMTLAEDALGGLVTAHGESGADVSSGLPEVQFLRPVEQLFVPAFLAAVGGRYPVNAVHDPSSEVAFLNGQCILVRAGTLAEVGGFSAVGQEVLEDVALAKVMKRAGKTLRLLDAQSMLKTRMYTSWAEIVSGFGKNAVPLFGGAGRAAMLGLLAVSVACAPFVAVLLAYGANDAAATMWTGRALAVLLVAQLLFRRWAKLPVWPVLFLPIAYAGFFYVMVKAATAREVSWRGRSYLQK